MTINRIPAAPVQTSDSLTALIQAVDTASSADALFGAVRALALAELEGAIPTLISVLSYNNPGAAVAAVDGLVRLGSASVPAIMEQLDDHNYTARAWAIRALAEIGDPRGLVTLLEAATTDFAASVRRAATKGLGALQWSCFPESMLVSAQKAALSVLCTTAQQDAEWVVRYAAVVGLETLAHHRGAGSRVRSHVQSHLEQIAETENSLAVRARIQAAQQHLKSGMQMPTKEENPPSLTAAEWQRIQAQLSAFTAGTDRSA